MFQLLVTSNVPSYLILSALIMELIDYSETSDLTRAIRVRSQKEALFIAIAVKT
jgi:hypothetical protein